MTLGKRHWPSFKTCGCTGFALALLQSVWLVKVIGLSQLTLFAITILAIATFFSLAIATKIIVGREFLIYYHQEIALLAFAALFLHLVRQPVLAYLDIEALGIGTFLACGRVGCLLVGCCHGRPSRWGTTYRQEHADSGFPAHLVGVRLFPIQLVESAMVVCLVICGVILLLTRRQPGEAFVSYLVLYGVGRFFLEFFRGDSDRNFLRGFSEAQLTSFLIETAVVITERRHILPAMGWHWLVPVLLGASMFALEIWRRLDRAGRLELLHPHHVDEIAIALENLRQHRALHELEQQLNPQSRIQVEETSRGYRLSLGQSIMQHSSIRHCSVSKRNDSLSITAAHVLARLIAQLEPGSGHCTILPGHAGVFHILFNAPTGSSPD